jgi:hypothetical protein
MSSFFSLAVFCVCRFRDSRGVVFEMETMSLAKATAVSTYDGVGDQCDCVHDFR